MKIARAENLDHLSLAELKNKYSTIEDRYVEIDGIDVHYRDEGQGPVILLIHGSSSTLRSYDAVADILKAKYRVIRYDVPPSGLSGSVSDDVLKSVNATSIPAKLLQKLQVSKVNVAGVSYGGTIALFLAADYPELVDRVIVSCAPAMPVDLTVVDFGPSLTKAQQAYGDYGDRATVKPRDYWRTYFNFYAGRPERISDDVIDQTFDFARRENEKNPTHLIAQVADQETAFRKWSDVTAPTLLIWGGSDALLPPAAAEYLAARLTNSQVSTILLPDVGHYPPIEVPDRFAEIVDVYVRSVDPQGLDGIPPPNKR